MAGILPRLIRSILTGLLILHKNIVHGLVFMTNVRLECKFEVPEQYCLVGWKELYDLVGPAQQKSVYAVGIVRIQQGRWIVCAKLVRSGSGERHQPHAVLGSK